MDYDKSKKQNKLSNIKCSVSNCRYYCDGNHCSAPNGIDVSSENAAGDKVSTFCSTFDTNSYT